MSTTDTELRKTQIRQLEAEIAQIQAQTIRTLVDAGRGLNADGMFDPTAVVQAVISSDLSLLAERRQPPSSPIGPPLTP